MTTAPTPWTAKYDPVSDTTNICDRNGKFLGVFWDGRNADEMLQQFKEVRLMQDTVNQLEDTIEKLESKVYDLEIDLKNAEA